MQLEIAKLDISFNYAIFAARLGDCGSDESKVKDDKIKEVVRFAAEDIARDAFGQDYVASMGLKLDYRIETFAGEKGVFARGWVELPSADMNDGFLSYLRSYWEGMVGEGVALYTTIGNNRPAQDYFTEQWRGYLYV